MAVSSIRIGLFLGATIPEAAPRFIAESLQSAEITQSDEGPSTFQLSFHADRAPGMSTDYALLSSPLLKPTTRVALTVALNGTAQVLMDGFITRQELTHEAASGAATLSVTGEDVSVMMDLEEVSTEFPDMSDPMIAAVVLAKYMVLGVLPEIPDPIGLVPIVIDRTPQQNSTDRAYLKQLARPHGYVFYVKPGPVMMMNTAYWGPPMRIGMPQKALTVDMGPATNVDSISFQYNALAPNLLHGMVQDTETDIDLPVLTLTGMRMPPFASDPAIVVNQPFVRNIQFTDPRLGALGAYEYAQAATDMSTDKVVVAQGEVDTLRYGSILSAPGLVGVRGVGLSYDGIYYLQSVTHRLSRNGYKQQFVLNREGTGTLTPEVIP